MTTVHSNGHVLNILMYMLLQTCFKKLSIDWAREHHRQYHGAEAEDIQDTSSCPPPPQKKKKNARSPPPITGYHQRPQINHAPSDGPRTISFSTIMTETRTGNSCDLINQTVYPASQPVQYQCIISVCLLCFLVFFNVFVTFQCVCYFCI